MALAKKKHKPRKPKEAVLDASNIKIATEIELAKSKVGESATAPYTVTIKNGSEAFVGTGNTIVDAFQDVPFPKTFFPLKGLVMVEHDGKMEQKFLFPQQMKLIMHNRIKRTTWAKLFSYAI